MQDFYTQDFQLSEKDIKLRELAVRYHQEAEAFDRTVCTGPVVNGSIQPATARELATINRNASKLMRILEDEARMFGATIAELRRAVAKDPTQ